MLNVALAPGVAEAAPDLLQRWVDGRWPAPELDAPYATPLDLTQPTQLLVTTQSDEALAVLDRGQTHRPTLDGLRRHEPERSSQWDRAYRWLERAYDARVDAGQIPRPPGPLVWTWPEAAAPWRLHGNMHWGGSTHLLLEVPSSNCLAVGWDEWHGPLNGSVHLNFPHEDGDWDEDGLMDLFEHALDAAHQARSPEESQALQERWWEVTCLDGIEGDAAEWLQVVIDRIEPGWIRERVTLPACECTDW